MCYNEEVASQISEVLSHFDEKLEVMEEILAEFQALQNTMSMFEMHVGTFHAATKMDESNLTELTNVSIGIGFFLEFTLLALWVYNNFAYVMTTIQSSSSLVSFRKPFVVCVIELNPHSTC